MTAYDNWKTEPDRVPGMHYHTCEKCYVEIACDDYACEACWTICEDCERLQAHADDIGIPLNY